MITLNHIVDDPQLSRLFTANSAACALQLWFIRIKSSDKVDVRFAYGRLLPYSYISNTWAASDNETFTAIGDHSVQLALATLYFSSSKATNLIELLSQGHTIESASAQLELLLPTKLVARFGSARIGDTFHFRPTAYLMNRDAWDADSLRSPHGGAGAFSASLCSKDKLSLFQIDGNDSAELADYVIEQLDQATGMNFGHADVSRFGDLEMLVFPALDDDGRMLLKTSWDSRTDFKVKFNLQQSPAFPRYLIRLVIACSGQTVFTSNTSVKPALSNLDVTFTVPEYIRDITDETEVEIQGISDDEATASNLLCCRWKIGYMRSISFSGGPVDSRQKVVRLNWLEKYITSRTHAERLAAVQTASPHRMSDTTTIDGRKVDVWVPLNRALSTLVERIRPTKSNGRFFKRLIDSRNEGRLDFAEWLKTQLTKYSSHQIVIFDPYFESAGLGLVVPNASEHGNYVIFRTLPNSKPDSTEQTGLVNLLGTCDQLAPLMRGIRLRIFGIKDGMLHDRYFLALDGDGFPAAGFQLSNSIQAANANHPMLITPIPADVLLDVTTYTKDLLRRAAADAELQSDDDQTSLEPLFDSDNVSHTPVLSNEPADFLNNPLASTILTIWTENYSLREQQGDALRMQLTELGYFSDDRFQLDACSGFTNWANTLTPDYQSFESSWGVVAEILANVRLGSISFREQPNVHLLEAHLINFLMTAATRTIDSVESAHYSAPAESYFTDPFKKFLTASYRPHAFFNAGKATALTWQEHFAIHILWHIQPKRLLELAAIEVLNLESEPAKDILRLSILGEIAGYAAYAAELGATSEQAEALTNSSLGVMRWMGLHMLRVTLSKEEGFTNVTTAVNGLSEMERITAISWLIRQVAGNKNEVLKYTQLVAALHETLPPELDLEALRRMVDAMRGNMSSLGWNEPWLFRDIVFPLIEAGRVTPDDATTLWYEDFEATISIAITALSAMFNSEVDGRTIEITAWLVGRSSVPKQRLVLASLNRFLGKFSKDIQRPLADSSNWKKWDTGLKLSMWILSFAELACRYVDYPIQSEVELQALRKRAHKLALLRLKEEWQASNDFSTTGLGHFTEEIWGEGLKNL